MDRNLTDYLPNVMKDVKEITAILQVEQPEFSATWDAVEAALNDQFINSATENGVSRWESILKIIPKATEELDTRKFRILTRLNEQLPYTMRTLMQQLESLCGAGGYSVVLENAIYTVHVRVSLVAKSNFDDVKSLLDRTVPANIVIDLTLKYNQHINLAEFKHSELALLTHYDLRNEVLKNGKRNTQLSFEEATSRRFL